MTSIIDDVCGRVTLPRIPNFFGPCRQVEIGLAYRMDLGRVPDHYTGRRGTVVCVCSDGDLEIELQRGGTVWVYHRRVHPVGPDGMTRPCPDDRGVS